MEAIIIILGIIGGVIYGVIMVVIYIGIGIKNFIKMIREWIERGRIAKRRKAYSKTNLGKIENFKLVLLSKRQEMYEGIERIKQDIADHQLYVESLQEELKKKQIRPIRRQIENQIAAKTNKQRVLAQYIGLLKEYIEETEVQENALKVLFKMVKFNQESMTVKDYDEKYKDLDSKIVLFNQYDFADLSADMIQQTENINLTEEAGIEKMILKFEARKESREADKEDDMLDLEDSILKNFSDSLDSFDELMHRFRYPNDQSQ